MKSKNFIPTLLALIIRLGLSGHSDSESVYKKFPVLGDKTQSSPNGAVARKQIFREKTKAVQTDASSNPSDELRIMSCYRGCLH